MVGLTQRLKGLLHVDQGQWALRFCTTRGYAQKRSATCRCSPATLAPNNPSEKDPKPVRRYHKGKSSPQYHFFSGQTHMPNTGMKRVLVEAQPVCCAANVCSCFVTCRGSTPHKHGPTQNKRMVLYAARGPAALLQRHLPAPVAHRTTTREQRRCQPTARISVDPLARISLYDFTEGATV